MKNTDREKAKLIVELGDEGANVILEGDATGILISLIVLVKAVCQTLKISPADLARLLERGVEEAAPPPSYTVDLAELRRQAGRE